MKSWIAALGIGTALSALAGPSLEEGFRDPPDEAKPQVWWHWMNGNVSKEGIVADLESMAAVGIGGAQIFDAGCAIPPGDVAFNSPEWYEMFSCAAETAVRLKLELCHANCSGWSSSGGPWVTPDKGMKAVLAPSETEVLKGPMRFVGKLPPPPLPATNRWTVIPPGAFRADIAYLAVPAVANLPGTTNHLSVADLPAKMFAVRTNPIRRDMRVARPGEAIARDRVIDVTRFVADDGTLSWDVPAGEWRILRLQYASTGRNNGPASEKGLGYEVDKLSAEAVRFHLDAYVGRLVKALGPNAGAHPYGLNNILVDSYEVGCQNWTQGFEREFERLAGYPITPYLPVLAGYVVGSVDESERFLEDYRRVIADLFAENYAGALQKRCHELGLRFSLEPYGNGPFDNLQYGRNCDIPVAEFWSHGQHRNDDCGNSRLAAHVAHVWGRRLVATESFTGEPTTGGRWLTTPFSIKAQGDCAFAAGVNRIVYHRFVHQPWKDPYLPGLTMGRWGMHYERSNTWWYEQREWLKYQARCQWMLMEGKFAADILYYYGEKAPNEAEVYYGLDPLTPPKGYDYDQCDREALLALTVRNGRVVAPSGVSYALLVLPKAEAMSLEALEKIGSLLDAGATVVAPEGKPTRVPGLRGYPAADAKLRRRVEEVWAKGVLTGSVEEALAARRIAADCLCDTPNVLNGWIHRRDDAGCDWYFVACRNPSAMDVKFSFPETGRVAELWDPETGAIERADEAEVDWRGRCVVTLRNLPPDGSMFVVFRDRATAESRPVRRRWRTVATVPVEGPWTLSFPRGWGIERDAVLPTLRSWTDFADENVRYFSGSAVYRTTLAAPSLAEGERCVLDLGDVRFFAEVTVNGKAFPSLWRPPFAVDVTEAVKAADGRLELSVKVTNLWPNRLIGDAHKPEDCRWQENEAFNNAQETGIVELPDWVRRGERSPTGRLTFTTWRHWTKDDEPLDSGLLGPVRLRVRAVAGAVPREAVCEAATPARPTRKESAWFDGVFEAHRREVRAGGAPIVFLGDSITAGWHDTREAVWNRRFREGEFRGLNLGIGGDTTRAVLWRIREGRELDGYEAKCVVVQIGTNNLGVRDDTVEDTVAGICQVVFDVRLRQPKALILVMPILPRGKEPDDPIRRKAERVNDVLRKTWTEAERILYFDIYNEFLNADGTLNRALYVRKDGKSCDWLHPNEKGYEIWAQKLLELFRRKLSKVAEGNGSYE